MINITRTADGRTQYVFNMSLMTILAATPADKREDEIREHAHLWVSEHEGYNSIEYDRMCEELEEELSYQVELYLDLNPLLARQ